jgi:hypothetical protein
VLQKSTSKDNLVDTVRFGIQECNLRHVVCNHEKKRANNISRFILRGLAGVSGRN